MLGVVDPEIQIVHFSLSSFHLSIPAAGRLTQRHSSLVYTGLTSRPLRSRAPYEFLVLREATRLSLVSSDLRQGDGTNRERTTGVLLEMFCMFGGVQF